MPGIILEFKKDENNIAADKETIATADIAVILYSYLQMPVRFASEGKDFFGFRGDPWLEMGVLHLASVGRDRLMKAYKGTPTHYGPTDVGCWLKFERRGDHIRITSSCVTENNLTGEVEATRLFGAFDRFALGTRELIEEEFPELLQREDFGMLLEELGRPSLA